MVRIVGTDAKAGLALVSALLIGACGGGTSGGAQTIGKSGGTVSKSGVTLTIPAGALSADTAITIATTASPSGYVLASAAYMFGPAGTTFAKPVTVSISLTGAAEGAHLFWSNAGGGFDDLGGTISTMTLTGEVTHFSVGFAGKAAADGGAAGSHGANTGADGGTAGAGGGAGSTGDAGGTGGAGGAQLQDAGSDADAMPAPPTPVVLVPFPNIKESGPPTIAIDDAYVYWVGSDTASHSVAQRVPKAGGEVTVAYQPPVRPSQGAPGNLYATLAVDATNLYVVIGDDIYHSEILKVAKDGSTHTEPSLLQIQGLGAEAGTIAVDSQNLYFDSSVGMTHVAAVPINGGSRAELFPTTGPGPNDPMSQTPIGFPNINNGSLVSDGTNVYYSAAHWMLKAPIGGGAPVVLVPFATDAAKIDYVGGSSHPAVSGGYVYWINYGDVFKVSVNGVAPGTMPETLVTGTSHGDTGYAVTDGQSLYYLDGGSLWKLPLTGGAPRKLIDAAVMNQYNFADGPIVVDATSVYLVAFGGQGIVKVAK